VSSLSLLSGGLSSLSCLRGCGGLGSLSGLGEGGGAILSGLLAARVDALLASVLALDERGLVAGVLAEVDGVTGLKLLDEVSDGVGGLRADADPVAHALAIEA